MERFPKFNAQSSYKCYRLVYFMQEVQMFFNFFFCKHGWRQWIWIFLYIPYPIPLELFCRLHTYALILRCSCETDFLDYLLEEKKHNQHTRTGKHKN